MPKRTSPQLIQDKEDLNDIDKLVVDKRNQQRAKAKKNRRNRHYTKQLLKNSLNLLDDGDEV
ncbi:hypothetical protein A3SI_19805 [Nitritalea halalkaliphila LW7]|uniref:Uncharacterized protein n=1 Tax=Nitritalea halalkaliphila LW7 TaxID=1189621 RepID=I5BS36_9BACT|nr:hypothetical protein [Nitritalea halalkaliphila]EIM72388.1 hypothetical protein A3SI_19805 [Nitritalea halalkaliphila LW7]